MAFFDSQLPPWLGRPGNGPAAFAQGVENNNNLMHGFMTAIEEKRQETLFPLKVKVAQMQMEEQAADLTTKINAMQTKTVNKEGVARWAETVADISKRGAWDEPESESALWGVIKQYPTLAAEPAVKQGLDLVKSAKVADFRQRQLDAMTEIRNRAIDQREEKLSAEQKKWEADRASREKMASEGNDTKIDVATLQADAKKYGADRRADTAEKMLAAKKAGESIDSKMRRSAFNAELHQAWSSSMTDEKFQKKLGEIKARYKVTDTAQEPAASEPSTVQPAAEPKSAETPAINPKDAIVTAFKNGKISREEAAAALRKLGYK